jgi:hypothetical protein
MQLMNLGGPEYITEPLSSKYSFNQAEIKDMNLQVWI